MKTTACISDLQQSYEVVLNLLWQTFVWKSSSNGWKNKMQHQWRNNDSSRGRGARTNRAANVEGLERKRYWQTEFANTFWIAGLHRKEGMVQVLKTHRFLLFYVSSQISVRDRSYQPTHLREILPHDLDEVWHGEVHDVVSPGGFQHHVWPQQVVAGEQAGGETLLFVFV